MSIKMKLIISYIAMILVPVTLIVLSGYLMDYFVLHPERRNFHGAVTFGIEFRNKETEQLSSTLTKMIKTQPDRFTDPEYLSEFEKKHNLLTNYMGIIARQDSKVVYVSPTLPRHALLKRLNQKATNSDTLLIINGKAFSFQQFDFFTLKGNKGNLFLLTDATSFYRFGKKIFILIPLALILFIILTNGILTYFMSCNIILPLNLLRNATEQIKVGNLDFQIPIHSKDELGKLAEAFEEMRCRLKESLELQLQYETNRKELISGISHDLKTPVTSIKGYVEGILDGVAGSPEKLEHYLKTIQAKTTSLDKLIDELFLFSKLDLGKLPFQFEKIQLQDLLQDFFYELEFELGEQNIDFQLNDYSEKPVVVYADREKLARVLHNLIENSIKYMTDKEKRLIIMEITDDSASATVSIHDNGRGISSIDLPYIFESFFRADRARNTDTDGSGLGLAIAKLIIAEHGGEIWAESDLGQGTTFNFSLPRIFD